MTWTVVREDANTVVTKRSSDSAPEPDYPAIRSPANTIHVRAIIDIDNEQAEIKELIASLQKHVKEETGG